MFNLLAVRKPPLTSQLTWLLPADDWAVLQVSHYSKTSLYIFLITTNEETPSMAKLKLQEFYILSKVTKISLDSSL